MVDVKNSFPDILDITALRGKAQQRAIEAGFSSDQEGGDAFRHIYTNAMVAWQNGMVGGVIYTEILGSGFELADVAATFAIDMLQSTGEMLGMDINPKNRADAGRQMVDSYMDFYNNQIGLEIGLSASSEEDIIQKVSDAIRSGKAIITPDESAKRIMQDNAPEENNPTDGQNAWENNKSSTTSGNAFDPAQLIQALTNKKRGIKNNPIARTALTSAAILAGEIVKSQKISLEGSVSDIFEKQTRDQSGKNSGSGLMDIINNIVGAAFNRQRASNPGTANAGGDAMQLSQSQQASLLAQLIQRGTRNL